MEEMVSLVSNVGFPIIACWVLYQQVNKMNEIIMKLTTTLQSIDGRLGDLEREVKGNGNSNN